MLPEAESILINTVDKQESEQREVSGLEWKLDKPLSPLKSTIVNVYLTLSSTKFLRSILKTVLLYISTVCFSVIIIVQSFRLIHIIYHLN